MMTAPSLAAPSLAAPSPAAPVPVLVAGPIDMDAMRWHRRLLVVAAPDADDPALMAQRRLLDGWRAGARDRDLWVVEVIGDHVAGAGDKATPLRRRLGLDPRRFGVVLVGKDGHVSMREERPIAPERLAAVIDAMPMRRAGGR